jgi:tetratricopeptide (TPR) repeat protein
VPAPPVTDAGRPRPLIASPGTT